MPGVHAWLLDVAHCLEPDAPDAPTRRAGATVRGEVERRLQALPTYFPGETVPTWLTAKAE